MRHSVGSGQLCSTPDDQHKEQRELIMMIKYLAALAVATSLGGCATMSTNDAMVPLQNETAKILGLASSDELTITNVHSSKPDTLGGQDLTYTATTTKGRILSCSAHMTPGLLTSPPNLSAPSCQAVKTHS
jgi:hypothetical protein